MLEGFSPSSYHFIMNRDSGGDGPAEVMAVDRSWFLLQDIDLPFTLLSAAESVLRQVVDDPVLEAVWASPLDRLDEDADQANAGAKGTED